MKHRLFNIGLNALSRIEALDACRKYLAGADCRTLCFLNAHCFNLAQSDANYCETINNADLLLNDGIGVKIVSLFAGVKLLDNLAGTDLIPLILKEAAELGAPVYLLGGRDGVAASAAQKMVEQIPGLQVAGCGSGYFSADEEQQVVDTIEGSGARLVVLGMGVPKQEFWAARNAGKFSQVRLMICGGAVLDFLSGTVPRAPIWLRQMRLEWLFRLCLEPGRMWRRYILGSFVLLFHILRLSLTSGSRSEA